MKSGFYRIPLNGLKEGSHLYDFKIDDNFFAEFEESEVKSADLEVIVKLVKRSAHMEMNVVLKGTVEIICDRCLENYSQEIEAENELFIKYGDSWEEIDDKVIMVPYGESEFDLRQLIYEFTHLGLPLKRIHPDDGEGKNSCSQEMLKKLGEHSTGHESGTDPRWQDLKMLKDKNLN